MSCFARGSTVDRTSLLLRPYSASVLAAAPAAAIFADDLSATLARALPAPSAQERALGSRGPYHGQLSLVIKTGRHAGRQVDPSVWQCGRVRADMCCTVRHGNVADAGVLGGTEFWPKEVTIDPPFLREPPVRDPHRVASLDDAYGDPTDAPFGFCASRRPCRQKRGEARQSNRMKPTRESGVPGARRARKLSDACKLTSACRPDL